MTDHFSWGDEEPPVIGGSPLPDSLVMDFEGDCEAPTDELGWQAFWLLKLNADKVALKCRQSDLAMMDDETKRLLIADVQRVLGIRPVLRDPL